MRAELAAFPYCIHSPSSGKPCFRVGMRGRDALRGKVPTLQVGFYEPNFIALEICQAFKTELSRGT